MTDLSSSYSPLDKSKFDKIPSTVICTCCKKEVSKYPCTYVTNEFLMPWDMEIAEKNPEKIFSEILCPTCAEKRL